MLYTTHHLSRGNVRVALAVVGTDARFPSSKKSSPTTAEGNMYIKALYHALPMNYITVSKLQSKLGGEANKTTVRKLMDKMTKEGYIESTNNRRLGGGHK